MEDQDGIEVVRTQKVLPGEKANFLLRLFFCWELPIFLKSLRKNIEEEDLHGPLKHHESSLLGDKLENAWNQEKMTRKNPSLLKALIKTFWAEFFTYGIIHFFSEIALLIFQPFCLKKLLDYFAKEEPLVSRQDAYMYAAFFALLATLYVITLNSLVFELLVLGMKVRVACASLIYRHSLSLSSYTFVKTTIGQIINLLSNDLKRFDSLFPFLPFLLWITPVELVLGVYIVDVTCGHVAIICIGLLILAAFAICYASQKVSTYRKKIAVKTDYRVRLMNGIIAGIQVIKMYTWEKYFVKVVEAARESEIEKITTVSYVRTFMISIKSFIQRLIVFLYLIFAILTDITTTAQKVFPLAGLFEILRVSTIAILPRVLVTFVEARITVSRIQEFLLSEYDYEYKENMKIKKVKRTTEELIFSGANGTYDNKIISNSKHLRKGILARDISVKWNPSSTSYALEKLTLSVSPKQLIAIVGAAGSGKTTVLNTILKEIPLLNGTLEVRGTISYSSQEAWIFASTIKQNILFGQALDANKYRKVVKVCALEHDFSLFPYGDNTVVGERGVMLSGGQKARINLARAVYTDADIYLLDDPLAAVDAHVATHLFNECILGYLKEKCVILVTHQIQYLDKANRIYFLEKGHVAAEGRYDELTTQQNEMFLKIAQQDSDTQRSESNVETETTPLSESKNLAKSKIDESDLTVNNGFKGYFTNDGNWIFTVAFFLLCVLLQALCLFSDYMVVVYVDLAQEQDKNNTIVSVNLDKEKPVKFFTLNSCLYVYGALIITIVIVTGIRALIYVKFSMQVARKLHTKMFLQIIRGAMKFFDTHQSGEILNRFAEDVGTVDENLPLALMETVQSFFTLIGVLILISILNYWLTIAMVVLVILFVFFAWIIIPVSRTINKIEARRRGPVVSHLASSLQGLTSVKAFNAQKILVGEFDQHQDRHSSALYLLLACHATIRFWVDMTCAIYIAVVTFSSFLVEGVSVSFIGLAITQSTIMTVMSSFLMKDWSEVDTSIVSVERILQYTKNIAEGDLGSRDVPKHWPQEGHIEFRSVSLRYDPDDSPILNKISFNVKPREKIGVIGRTGAGKSSLISVLYRLYPFDGQVVIDGVDTKEISLTSLRSVISIVPQNPVLFSETLRKNLDPLNEHSDVDIWNALEQVELKDAISELPSGLETSVSEGGSNFSVGQKQLLCLVRAILKDSKIIILDEATANIDFKSDELIQATVRRRFKDCTIITVAHRLMTVMDSDKILVMDSGQVVEFDHPYHLLQNSNGFFYKYVHKSTETIAESLINIAEKSYFKKIS